MNTAVSSSSRIPGICTSRGIYPYRPATSPSRRDPAPIRFGDELYVRLRFDDGSELSMATNRAADMSELTGEVRFAFRRRRGLVKMTVRNATRGWTACRPLMLYGESYPAGAGWRAAAV